MTDTRSIPELATALNQRFDELWKLWCKRYTVPAEIKILPTRQDTFKTFYLCFDPDKGWNGFRVSCEATDGWSRALTSSSLDVRMAAADAIAGLEHNLRTVELKAGSLRKELAAALSKLNEMVVVFKNEADT